jgi:glucose-6-phosphate isomerase
VEKFQTDYVIPNLHPEREEISYLGGKKLSQLLNAECLATEIAITKAGRPIAASLSRNSLPKNIAHSLCSMRFRLYSQGNYLISILSINPA